MHFDPAKYGSEVAAILALDGAGGRMAPLVCGPGAPANVRAALAKHDAKKLFPRANDPQAAMAGLWLYFSCFDEAHKLIDDPVSPEGTFWHAIAHRREPDAGNAAYWFRQLGDHPVFQALAREAREILQGHPEVEFPIKHWDPFAFIDFCERARREPGSAREKAATEIQRVEWQLLFDFTVLKDGAVRA
jgi:hypothetical protein